RELLNERRSASPAVPRAGHPAAKEALQLPLFSPAELEVLQRLRETQPERLRPVDALVLLSQLKERLEGFLADASEDA
ncbi:MAG TPA: hypothetical protein VKA63_05240, partial [Candidatus Krumholzibacteria bacterium]|nr:hypothetical protein [Candidatus Krumholzibacteria bacterium]